MVSERHTKTPSELRQGSSDQACCTEGTCGTVAMLLQAPRLAHCHLYGSHRQQPDLSRVTRARRNPGCKSSLTTVIDPAQTLEEQVEASSQVEREFLAKSQLKPTGPAATDMGSTVQVPRNKVLTTSMIAHATNKDVNQVSEPHTLSLQRVAYQGVPGAYSESAARKASPNAEPLPCEQFEVAFQALSQWVADTAVLPIENSLGGSIHTVYDLLLRYRLHIIGEVSVEVNHCLMVLPGVKKSEVRRVMSHPQALAQVDNYLRNSLPGATKEAVDDTAGAAQTIAQQGWRDAAAVASRRAAELYGLEILEDGIQDMENNITRFIQLSRDPLVSTQPEAGLCKTSIVFAPKQLGPGQLFRALSVFALRDIDMSKIESRPMRDNPIVSSDTQAKKYNYLFYIDFVGTLADQKCQNALRHLQEIASFMRVLGSYPMDKEFQKPPEV
ncbi:TPA: hypothetical protein ACH3X3_011871 [Trebouxia sp. C0006]